MKPGGPPRLAEAAVVGVGIHGLGLGGAAGFMELLFRPGGGRRDPEEDPDAGLLALAAAVEAHAGCASWNPIRSAVFLGLEAQQAGGPESLAGRIQRRFGFGGLGGACLGDELGGNRALNAAVRRIQAGVLEGALVGAVQAWRGPSGGALAVFLALRRREAAERSGDPIWAVLGPGPERDRRCLDFKPDFLPGPGEIISGLLQVAAGCVMAAHHAWYCREGARWEPLLDRTDGAGFVLEVETPCGDRARTDFWRPSLPGAPPRPLLRAPAVSAFAGASMDDLLERMRADAPGGAGPVRLALVSRGERERRDLLDRIPAHAQRGDEGWVEPGAFLSSAPVQGKVACLFTSGGNSYLGMGRELLLGMPSLPMSIHPLQDLGPAGWAYGGHRDPGAEPPCESAGTLFLSQVHAAFTRDILGLRPDLAMGLSRGELSALAAYGAWGAPEGEPALLRLGEVFARLQAGTCEAARRHWGLPEGTEVRWRNWTVFGPVAKVLERVAHEPQAYVSIVFSQVHCQLAGESEACRRVLSGCPGLTAFPAPGLAEHTPVMAAMPDAWRQLLLRPTRPVPGVAFYSHHLGRAHDLSDDQVAAALAGQAMAPLDFPTAAWRAWDNGVRVFIEHGPGNLLTSALLRLLPRDGGVFLALDAQGENSLARAVRVAAELWCRGLPVDLARMQAALGQAAGAPLPVDPMLEVAASLFAASLERTGDLEAACQACLQATQGKFLEFLGPRATR